MLLYSSFTEVF